MTDPMTEGRRPTWTDWKIVAAFLVISLAARFACIRLNAAEYTDGILQITAFEYGFTFWPPLYTVLVKILFPVVGDLELAGKIISILASSLIVVPLYLVAFRFGGRRAAVYAILFYLANAIAGRWGIRVMSDSLFSLLFFSCAAVFLDVIGGQRELKRPGQAAFLGASIAAPLLAAMTRYQGVFLLPLECLAWLAPIQRPNETNEPRGRPVAVGIVLLMLWTVPFGWMIAHFGGHGQQIGQRAGTTVWMALLNYWNLAEAFVLLFPYFITVPVFVLCVVGFGVFVGGDRAHKVFGWTFFIFAGLIVAMQSVFSSFQSRYLLPLIPFMMVMAGVAAARWEEVAARRRTWVRITLGAMLVYSFVWTGAVLYLQRGAFGDIKEAARFCAGLPKNARIYSTESYKPQMPAVKMSYWAKRDISGFMVYTQNESFKSGGTVIEPGQALANTGELLYLLPGDYVCFHSGYGGLSLAPLLAEGMELHRLYRQVDMLRLHYELEEVGVFGSELVALLPDIMENPDSHQNPAAWFFRYYPQKFRTRVFRVAAVRSGR